MSKAGITATRMHGSRTARAKSAYRGLSLFSTPLRIPVALSSFLAATATMKKSANGVPALHRVLSLGTFGLSGTDCVRKAMPTCSYVSPPCM